MRPGLFRHAHWRGRQLSVTGEAFCHCLEMNPFLIQLLDDTALRQVRHPDGQRVKLVALQ